MGGTTQPGAGGLPIKTLAEQRDAIIATFTNGLDAAIAQAKEAPFAGIEPARFEADVTFNFVGTTEVIKVRPALDLAATPAPAPVVEAPATEAPVAAAPEVVAPAAAAPEAVAPAP
jgi:hypothetical protein